MLFVGQWPYATKYGHLQHMEASNNAQTGFYYNQSSRQPQFPYIHAQFMVCV